MANQTTCLAIVGPEVKNKGSYKMSAKFLLLDYKQRHLFILGYTSGVDT